jgi:hypothetical protein
VGDGFELRRRDQLVEHAEEAPILDSRHDVLKAISPEHGIPDGLLPRGVEATSPGGHEVLGIGLRLCAEDAVHGGHQLDEIGDGPIAFRGAELRVLTPPLEPIEVTSRP